jgi:uncharacterized protein (TIGR00369 family)
MQQDTLELWLAQEREIVARRERPPGPVRPEDVTGLSGLEMFRKMLDGKLHTAPIGTTLDFLIVEAEDGRVVFQGTPGPAHLNPMGGIHGGWYATLLDSAMGCAVATKLPVGRGYTTAELSVNLVKAIGPKVQRVRAEGKVVHAGRQIATAEGRLYGPDGTLYAHGTTTCLVFEMK